MTTATRTWGRAVMVLRCGLCGASIPKGDPLVRVRVPVLKRALYRCKACVGPAPSNLPALVERELGPFKPFVHILTGADALPLDFKAAAAGREPGEEG